MYELLLNTILNILRVYPCFIDLLSLLLLLLFAHVLDPFHLNPFLLFRVQTLPQKIGQHMICKRITKMHHVIQVIPVGFLFFMLLCIYYIAILISIVKYK